MRAKKILQKIGEKGGKNENFNKSVENSEDRGEMSTFERGLYKKIVQFEEVLCEAAKEKAPYKVCGHLYELAQEFSRFYEHEQVVGGERETELVELVKIYVNVMERGLGVLGIEVPERM